MPNEQLVAYVRDQIGKGIGRTEIAKALLATGWPTQEVNSTFESLGVPMDGTPNVPSYVSHVPSPVYTQATQMAPQVPTAPLQSVAPGTINVVQPIKYAGFWIRVAALMVDGIILGILQQIIALVFGKGILVSLVSFIIAWVYAVLMITNYRATLGKMAVGLHVERVNGERIGFWRACLREIIGKLLSSVILGIGYLMAAWTKKKQGLHDMIADTVVVENDPNKSKTVWVVVAVISVFVIPVLIVGILSTVILASLNVARTKGSDAAIQSYFSTIQTEAEVYYVQAGKNSYTGVCVDPTIARELVSAQTANGGTVPVCSSSATAYAASSPLVTDRTKFWCIDSTGTAKIVASFPANGQTSCGL